MANPDAPFGFRPWQHGSGGTSCRVGEYALPTAYGTALYTGDTVKLSGTGITGEGMPSINISTTNTDQILGIFAGVRYVAADGSVTYKRSWTASTAEQSGSTITALVWDDPSQLFIAQCDGTTVITDIGCFAGVVTTHTGSHVTGISAQEISTGQASETTFKIERLIGKSDAYPCRNAAGNQDFFSVGANGLAVVRIVKHERGAVATVET